MTKEGRIPCLNPKCRRTDANEDGKFREIVCYKCWKLTPKELTDRYKSLRKRAKRLEKLVERRVAKGAHLEEFTPLLDRAWTEFDENWAKIHRYWCDPAPEMAPEGLDHFLEEVGLA